MAWARPPAGGSPAPLTIVVTAPAPPVEETQAHADPGPSSSPCRRRTWTSRPATGPALTRSSSREIGADPSGGRRSAARVDGNLRPVKHRGRDERREAKIALPPVHVGLGVTMCIPFHSVVARCRRRWRHRPCGGAGQHRRCVVGSASSDAMSRSPSYSDGIERLFRGPACATCDGPRARRDRRTRQLCAAHSFPRRRPFQTGILLHCSDAGQFDFERCLL